MKQVFFLLLAALPAVIPPAGSAARDRAGNEAAAPQATARITADRDANRDIVVVVRDDDGDVHVRHDDEWFFPEDGAWLGVHLMDLNDQLGAYFGVEDGHGALITEVEEDSPAAAAGLKAGDLIVRIDDHDVDDTGDLIRAIRHHEEGDEVTLRLLRRGKRKKVTVTLGERPEGPDVALGPDMPEFPFWGPERFLHGHHRFIPAPDRKLRHELENLRADIEELRARLDELEQAQGGKH